MALLYEHVQVNGTANDETLATLVTSTQARKKRVKGILVTEVTGTLQHDAVIRVYHEQERLVDMPVQHLLADNDTDTRYIKPFVELGIDLPVGESLDVGMVSGATASNIDFVAVYELM